MVKRTWIASWVGAWLGVLALAGCPSGYEPDDDSAADDDAADDDTAGTPPSISAVEPPTGSPAGGYTANVYGANFTDTADTDIYFGTSLAVMVGCGPAMCTVQVPAAGQEGAVDVTLSNSNGDDTLIAGFTYEEDLTGTVSYYSVLSRLEYAYPEAYEPVAVSETFATASFFTPEQMDVLRDVLWGGVLPGLGACAAYDRQNDWETPSVWALGAGLSVDLVGPMTYTLEKDWSTYSVSGLPVGDYMTGTYTLDIGGGSDLQPEQVANALIAPPEFFMTPPYAGETMNLSTFQAGLNIELSETCEQAALNLDIYDTTAVYVESVVCYASSTNTLMMPAAELASYFSAGIIAVRADCYSVSSNPVYSGSRMIGIGRTMVSGVIYIQ